jgi:type IV pilus assembly protein PilA
VITKLRKRIESEKGFTLIEMLIVIIILGILMAIAVPAYLKFRDRANEAAAKSNVRAAVPAVEAYGADHDGYTGMTLGPTTPPGDNLRDKYDAAIDITIDTSPAPSATTYCIQSTEGGKTFHKAGPAAEIEAGACP